MHPHCPGRPGLHAGPAFPVPKATDLGEATRGRVADRNTQTQHPLSLDWLHSPNSCVSTRTQLPAEVQRNALGANSIHGTLRGPETQKETRTTGGPHTQSQAALGSVPAAHRHAHQGWWLEWSKEGYLSQVVENC